MKLEDRRGYSKPVVDLDMLWNIAFVVVSAVMLIIIVNEKPNTPIRLWICGLTLQCLVYVVLVWLEFRRRNTRRSREEKRRGVVKFRMSIGGGGGFWRNPNFEWIQFHQTM